MSVPARRWVSVEEYLAREERADSKSEYFDGEIFAIAGASPQHNLISVNILRELGNQLEETHCLVYPSDQRVTIPDTGLYTYPDVTVVCEESLFGESDRWALLNPTLLVEVLSECTEAYDRGEKFAHYRRIPSLKEYVLVASDRQRIERFNRQEGGAEWVLTECSDPDGSLALHSVGCALSLTRVYSNVDFPAGEPGRRRAPGSPKD